MNRQTKRKLKKIKEFFDVNLVKKLGQKSKFIQRKSKLDALAFLKFCVFGDAGICKNSLSTLCTSSESKREYPFQLKDLIFDSMKMLLNS